MIIDKENRKEKQMKTLKKEELALIDKYFRAVNYLSVAQLYLLDNPLLTRPLEMKDIKPNVVGHFGTAPGQNFIYTHLNRIIKKYDLNMIYISGPGHGGQAMIANSYLDGSYSKIYPEITEDLEGLKKLCRQFSFPGGVSSHVSPEVPGSIHEGGELGYSLAHAYGAILDNQDLIAACVVGDGEAETGPLATSWHLNKFINPKTDGVVLPILHLNGYKIANPTIFGRMSNDELYHFFTGCSYKPYLVSGDNPHILHEEMAHVLEMIIKDIRKIKKGKKTTNIVWPMLILKTPKGWTGPKKLEGKVIEGSFRSHQVPVVINYDKVENLEVLENWLRSYHPEELFDENGRLLKEIKNILPRVDKTMSLNPHANGGMLTQRLNMPNYKNYQLKFRTPGSMEASDMLELGKFIRDIVELNPTNFRIFGPDEALSNRLNYVFEKTNRKWNGTTLKTDEFLSSDGRVVDSILSEHALEGMLEGYLLTGRYGFFHTYEAFVRIVDSMASQHAKWLKMSKELDFRYEIPSLNYILTSHIWQQDHNGFTHQDPGFLNHLVTKKADTVRIYLPFDTNCLISCFNHCITTKNYINVIVASKHLRPQWLTMNEAITHCQKGIGTLDFISSQDKNPDIVMACAGDTPTLEVIAAAKIMKEYLPKLKIRVVNVVDLMKLESNKTHPHGLSDSEYNQLFTKDKPIIFAFHGYAPLIHQLVYKRENKNLHVHGYLEEGTITTPFDMRVQNRIDRYHLILDALKYLEEVSHCDDAKHLSTYCRNMLKKHHKYIREYGKDMDEVLNFKF